MRYIDADRLRKDILGLPNCYNGFSDTYDKALIIERIDEQPTADVVEVDKVNKIYEKLADLFDIPCNYSPCDEIMFESERCREDCGNISDAECWKRYFEVVCDGEKVDT